MNITLSQVQEGIADIANRASYSKDILYELLSAYGRSTNSIAQLKAGTTNRATEPNEVLQKDVVYFKSVPKGAQLEQEVEKLYENPLTQRYKPRYVIVTDLKSFAAKDTIKNTTLSIDWVDIDNYLEFFYGWTGNEVVDAKTEAVADRRAADKMNLLYSEIEKLNYDKLSDPKSNFRHELNVFFTRLLFCFFAEDTGLFNQKQFSDAIKLTQQDGSDLHDFFEDLFEALDSPDRSKFKVPYSNFPHVNGSLFNTAKHKIAIPNFNAQSRHLILECAYLNWGEINPDIFGTMFQGVVDPARRDENGMDYTSVPNIMKVIEPLFLDELRERFDAVYNTPKSLRELLARIRKIKVFDPACGSGNFLIIAFKELRLLESAILARLEELKLAQRKKLNEPGMSLFNAEELENIKKDTAEVRLLSSIELSNFYGIEIDDFAHELAILSLYLAKHQMDSEFEKQFLVKLNHLPLIENENIVKANAARIEWNEVLKNNGSDEIYLIGNPPYKGPRWFSTDQKQDAVEVLGLINGYGNLDYISIWFVKGSNYIGDSNAELAFVTTNSISQGVSVDTLWTHLLKDLEINFAHQSFRWANNARDQAGVTVAVISLRTKSKKAKFLYFNSVKHRVDNINAYLLAADDIFIKPASKPISHIQPLDYGSFALDDGNFTISEDEYNELISTDPRAEKFLKPFIGAAEFLRGINRWAVWIGADKAEEAQQIPVLKAKIDKVFEWRDKSNRANTKKLASTPWRFAEIRYQERDCIISPIVSSERREYIPMGYLPKGTIVSNAAFAIYDAEPWLFALLESKMHMTWIRTVCGQLETRIRYSSTLGYNTFPINPLTEDEKSALNQSARNILLARAAHPEKTLADMYDPDKMPDNLREAHDANDRLVDSIYKRDGFKNDEERLAYLFKLYEKMTSKQ